MKSLILAVSFLLLAFSCEAQSHFYDTSRVKIGQMQNRIDSLVFPVTFKVVEKGNPFQKKKGLSIFGRGIVKFPGTWVHTQAQLIDSINTRIYRLVQKNYQPW